MPANLTIHYHRDFDGMVSAAILAHCLRARGEEALRWATGRRRRAGELIRMPARRSGGDARGRRSA